MEIKRIPVRYTHPVRIFVPVYQKNFDGEGNLLFTPTFEYSMSDATQDEQLAWSMKPDYVLELSGIFDATTRNVIID